MIGEYRFFQDFFDGQIVAKERYCFKLFKTMLVSVMSVIGLFLFMSNYIEIFEFLLLEFGLIWNIYSGLSKKISIIFGIVVGLLYFVVASKFSLYANCLIYVSLYIPFQLIASIAKDYEEGDFVQIKKTITDINKIIFVTFFAVLTATLALLDSNLGAKFTLLDSISASLLVCSAVLRNERYFEYYIFRIFACVMSLALWIVVIVEFGSINAIAIVLMYFSYLLFDTASLIEQSKTYKNQYMIVLENYKNQEDKVVIEKKINIYKKSTKSKNKNNID